MRIAVAGGTGQVGRHTVSALREAGHEPVPLSRSAGVDVATGEGLDQALAGVHAVVDATNTTAREADQTRAFFGAATGNLLQAGEHAGVRHHVVLSIIRVDRIEGNAHYAGKRRQEELVRQGPLPYTIVRAPQFFEFPEMVLGWTRDGEEYHFRGCFHQVGDDRIVQTFMFEGMPDDVALETLTFEDLGDGRTRLHAQSLVDSFEGRDQWLASGMETGVEEGYAKLDALIGEL